MGPKTLCNACGVRYKSGRLLPEYRPAASPTFVDSIHSNSHRKVLELHRQRGEEGMQGPEGQELEIQQQHGGQLECSTYADDASDGVCGEDREDDLEEEDSAFY
eukprot:c17656_g1_i1 orf=2-313(+)